MPLEMISPPDLVHVRDVDGAVRPALLLARRDGRSYVQVSRGAGDNVLRWLPTADVGRLPAGEGPGGHVPVTHRPVRLRPPRSGR